MTLEILIQIVAALIAGAIMGGVGHLWIKTERLDREQARHAEKLDSFGEAINEVKLAVLGMGEKVSATANAVARIEGALTNGFAMGAKAPARRK